MRAIRKITALLGATCLVSMATATAGTFIWVGGNGNWNDPANWGGTAPSIGSDVLIDDGNAAASSVLLDTSISIANLTIDANDQLDMSDGSRTLTLTGSVMNDGVIRLADVGTGIQLISIQGEVPLDGTGMLIFDSDEDNRIQAGINTVTDRLVVGLDQLITTGPTALPVESFIQVRVTNNGIIEANEGGLDLQSLPKINQNLMRAINGGNLRLETTITNIGANIEADATSVVGLNAAIIDGGTLGGTGRFDVEANDATFLGTTEAVTIGSDATIELVDSTNERLSLEGTIINNGEIVLRDTGGGVNDIGIRGPVSLDGSGTVRLEGNDDSRITALINGAADILTIGANQTITTDANTLVDNAIINCRIVNNGIIEADGGELDLETHNPKTNNNIIRGMNGGNVVLSGVVLENASGTLTADAGSMITYANSTRVQGGLLNGTGTHFVANTDGFFDGIASPVTIAAGSTVGLTGGTGQRLRLEGTIINNGEIVVNEVGGNVNDIGIVGDVMLDGTGLIRLEGADDSRITALLSGAADILHIGSNQTLTTDANTTIGNAIMNCRFVNSGVIEANAGELDLDTHSPKTNNALMRAVNGGNLFIEGIELENANGEIRAEAASTVTYTNNMRLLGGTLSGAGRHVITPNDAIFDGVADAITIAAGARVDLSEGTGNLLRLEGTIINDGQIIISDVGGSITNMGIVGSVMLGGSGSVLLTGADDNRIQAVVSGANDILTIGPNQTITTTADTLIDNTIMNCRFVNEGIIEANGGGFDLETHSPKTNNNIMRAVAGGNLRIEGGVTIENAAGVINVDGASTLSMVSSGRVEGGTLNCSGTLATTGSANELDGVTVKPGDSPGTMTIDGAFSPNLTAATVLEMEIGGMNPGVDHDVINASGQMRLGGTLRAFAINGLNPQLGDRFVIMNVGSFNGTFDAFAPVGFPDGTLSVRFDTTSGTTGELVIVRVGDMNCDGVVSVSDIGPFVIALTDPAGYATQFPACEIFNGDINADGAVSVSDIGPFVALLTGG